MLRRALVPCVSLMIAAAGVLAVPNIARADSVEGTVTGVDGGTMTVRTDSGAEQHFRIGNRTRIVFQSSADAAAFPNAKADMIQNGMRVRVNPDAMAGNVLDRVHVLGMPAGARPAGAGAAATLPAVQPPVPAGSVAKARLQKIDAGRGIIEADVAGRTQSYGVKEPRRLGSFREGDMVLLTFDRNGYVTSIASATLLGRVTSVNSAAVTVNVDGREETYGLTKDVAKNEGKKLRVGDMIRFEFEDRPGGLKVITAIQ